MKKCMTSISIPNTAKKGSNPTMYDSANILGGQQYEVCNLPATHFYELGDGQIVYCCAVHSYNKPYNREMKLLDI